MPFYAAENVLMFRTLGIPEIAGLLGDGGLFITLAIIALNKKDI